MDTKGTAADQFDQLVLDEFPYPIALAYRRLLETDDPAEQAEFCRHAFYYGIRAISFALVIQYLKTPPDTVNDTQLNEDIHEHLKAPRTQQWISLLGSVLRAYRDHVDLLFIPELYSLFWERRGEDLVERSGSWDMLNDIDRLSNIINDSWPERSKYADEILKKLREALQYFEFLANYELWYVRDHDAGTFTVEVFRGQEKSIRHVREEDIKPHNKSSIEDEKFYLRKRQGDSHCLVELHPLIVNIEAMRQLREYDTGVYETFWDKGTLNPDDDEIVYRLLSSNQARPLGGDLVSLFRDLYELRLGEKRRAFSSKLPLTPENIYRACQNYTKDQIRTASGKYLGEAYVERLELNRVLTMFMRAEQPGLIISGNVGVGKTSLLVHFYQEHLVDQPQTLTVWLDGALLDAHRGLAETLIHAWDRLVIFDTLPKDDGEAQQYLRDILDRYLPKERLVLIIDGINENNQPMEAFERINDFILSFPRIETVKIIMTTRPQVWRYTRGKYLKTRFKPQSYFGEKPGELADSPLKFENDSVVLARYDREELDEAFSKYASYYQLVDPDLENLHSSLRNAIHEPLLLRLTCEALQGRRIPPEMTADKVIQRLIEKLVGDITTNLEQSDFDFLTEWVVPQFLPPGELPLAELTRDRLRKIQVTPSRTLDDLIADTSEYPDLTTVNAHAQRLMDTGWLVRTGPDGSYKLRFRYEYFYEFFVGTQLFEEYKKSPNKAAFFESLVADLDRAFFLWGPLRNLLIDLLTHHEFDLIERLGQTKNELQYELLVSVLSEYYPDYSAWIAPIFTKWLQLSEVTLAPQIVANVALTCKVEDLLFRVLTHPNEQVRFLVIQGIYSLWEDDPQLVRSILIKISKMIRRHKVWKQIDLLETLFRCSLLLCFFDYPKYGAKMKAFETVLEVWRPVIRKLALVSGIGLLEAILRRVRRRLVLFAVKRILKQVARIDETGGGFFSYHDVEAFFNVGDLPQHKAAFNDLLPHLEAATAPDTTVQNLADTILDWARKGSNDLVTAYLAVAGMIAHTLASPSLSFPVLDTLLTHLEELYPQTTDRAWPTAAIWYPMMLNPFIHIPHKRREDYSESEFEQVVQILEIFIQHAEQFDSRYMGMCKFEHRKPVRIVAGQEYIFGYALQIPELGSEKLNAYLQRVFAGGILRDEQKILDLPFILNDAMVYHNLPEAGIAAMRDTFVFLRPYLVQNPEFAGRFWDGFRARVLPWVGAYKGEWVSLVEDLQDEHILPEDVETRILTASPTGNFDYYFMLAANQFLVASVKGRDASVRNLLRWGFNTALEVRDIQELGIEVVAKAGNLIYGGDLFYDRNLVPLDL